MAPKRTPPPPLQQIIPKDADTIVRTGGRLKGRSTDTSKPKSGFRLKSLAEDSNMSQIESSDAVDPDADPTNPSFGAEPDDENGPLHADKSHRLSQVATSAAYGAHEESVSGSKAASNVSVSRGQSEGSSQRRELEGDGLSALDPELDRSYATAAADDEQSALEKSLQEKSINVNDENATKAGARIRVEVTEGPDRGKFREFKRVRMVLGRMPGVDFQLTDTSVSRKHAELVRGDNGALLRDLGSGNGTKLNGVLITEKQLKHNDIIAIGKTQIRFIDDAVVAALALEAAAIAAAAAAANKTEEKSRTGQATIPGGPEHSKSASKVKSSALLAPLPEESQSPARKLTAKLELLSPLQKAGGVAGVLVFLLISVSVVRSCSKATIDPMQVDAKAKIQQAQVLLNQENLEEASSLVSQAEKEFPGADTLNLRGKIEEEKAVKKTFESAALLVGQERFEQAREEVKKIPVGNSKRESQRKQFISDLDKTQIEFQVQSVKELLATGETEEATAIAAKLPEAVRKDLERQLQEAKQREEEQRELEAKQAAAALASADKAERARRAKELEEAFQTVQRHFNASDWERAASDCDRVVDSYPNDDLIKRRSQILKDLIPEFGQQYDEGVRRFKAGQLAAAAPSLKKARELYGRIEMQTAFAESMGTMFVQAGLAAGKDSMLKGELSRAATYYKDVLRVTPTEPHAVKAMEEIQQKAEALYQTANAEQSSDPTEATKKLRVVLELTTANTAVHQRAQKLLKTLTK